MNDADAAPPLQELVPHEPPMLLLDRLQSHGAEIAICEVAIRADSPFLEHRDGVTAVPAVVGIEYMAQCVAVFAGLSARAAHREPRIGFLIGCRELQLNTDRFCIGEKLVVEARWVWGESHLGSFACKVTRDGETVVRGTLTVYRGMLPEGTTQ